MNILELLSRDDVEAVHGIPSRYYKDKTLKNYKGIIWVKSTDVLNFLDKKGVLKLNTTRASLTSSSNICHSLGIDLGSILLDNYCWLICLIGKNQHIGLVDSTTGEGVIVAA